MVAGRPSAEEQALAEFGENLGMAFQLVDDALDYAADQATLGKTVGDDFREGKITLPVLAAYAAGDAQAGDFWRRTIEASEQTEADLDHAMDLVHRSGAVGITLARAAEFVEWRRPLSQCFPTRPIDARWSRLRTTRWFGRGSEEAQGSALDPPRAGPLEPDCLRRTTADGVSRLRLERVQGRAPVFLSLP